MTIEKMTLEQKNKFFTLLIGKCWHEWSWTLEGQIAKCWLCGQLRNFNHSYKSEQTAQLTFSNPDYYASLSGFQVIKEHMEKELPLMWACYHWWCLKERLPETLEDIEIILLGDLIQMNKRFLDLDNLLAYLLQNTDGWGWKICPTCLGTPRVEWSNNVCPRCNGTGKVKHPALLYAESVKEKPCEKR